MISDEIPMNLIDEPGMVATSAPNSINTISDTNANVKSDGNHERARNGMSITPKHKKWFGAVHNCWLGHRGVKGTLDMLKERQCTWNSMESDVKS